LKFRFIEGASLPLEQLRFEGLLAQSKAVIFRESKLNVVVVTQRARVEWHPSCCYDQADIEQNI
jgi:hypothetical protein